MSTPPPDAVCIEPNCINDATTERVVSVRPGGWVTTEWVCAEHVRKP